MYIKDTLLPLLDQQNINYTIYQHEAIAHGDIEFDLPDMKGTMLKNLVLTNKNRDLYLFTLPLHYRANLKALSNALGVPRFSFASVSDLTYIGTPPGHVSPFCLLNDLNLQFKYVQPVELDNFDLVNCHPLDNHFSVDIARHDLEALVAKTGHEVCKVEGAVIID